MNERISEKKMNDANKNEVIFKTGVEEKSERKAAIKIKQNSYPPRETVEGTYLKVVISSGEMEGGRVASNWIATIDIFGVDQSHESREFALFSCLQNGSLAAK